MASIPVMQSTIANDLQDTLESIMVDDTEGLEAMAEMPKYYEERTTKQAFVDMNEYGGLGVAQYVPEGEEIPAAGISEGAFTRTWMRKFGLRAMATEEALEDGHTDKVISLAKKIKRALWKAADIDAAQVFNRATDTNYPGGDGQPLASASHTLPGGGTFSNLMATPTAPSESAYIIARAQADEMVDRDGAPEGKEIMKVCFPINQRGAWEILSFSEKSPAAGEFNAVNLINRDKVKLCPIRHWTASDVDYAFMTNAEDGLFWYWRKKMSSRTWVTEAQDIMNYTGTFRAGRGWGDPRCTIYADN
jgi:hypothetical protein